MRVWEHASQKSLDFRPSEIVSDEYRARIPRIMETACLVLEAYIHVCRRSAVMKRDVDHCDCECEVQEFSPRLLGKREVLRMDM